MRYSDEDWEGCLRSTTARTGKVDIAKARALANVANARIDFFKSVTASEKTLAFVFEGHYSSTIELIHAACLVRGFHVSNHLCLGFFLRDALQRRDLFRLFDVNRQRRNDLVYYGRFLDEDVARNALSELSKVQHEMRMIVVEAVN